MVYLKCPKREGKKIHYTNAKENTTMKKYKEEIEMGFISENELTSFLYRIADDERLSAKQYQYLRYLAIEKFYEN